MIKSFKNKQTEQAFDKVFNKRIPYDIAKRVKRRLDAINSALTINDLLIPPSNRLEKLSGNRKEQYSIRVNDQFRICFVFESGNAYNVELTDYH